VVLSFSEADIKIIQPHAPITKNSSSQIQTSLYFFKTTVTFYIPDQLLTRFTSMLKPYLVTVPFLHLLIYLLLYFISLNMCWHQWALAAFFNRMSYIYTTQYFVHIC